MKLVTRDNDTMLGTGHFDDSDILQLILESVYGWIVSYMGCGIEREDSEGTGNLAGWDRVEYQLSAKVKFFPPTLDWEGLCLRSCYLNIQSPGSVEISQRYEEQNISSSFPCIP